MGPDRGMSHSTIYRDRMTPLVWGGSLSSSPIFPDRQRGTPIQLSEDNHSGMREIGE